MYTLNTEFINPWEKVISPITGEETGEYRYPELVKKMTQRIENGISSVIRTAVNKNQIKQKK